MKISLQKCILPLLSLLSPLAVVAAAGEAPYIIFISSNTTAGTAVDEVVLAEYNLEKKLALYESGQIEAYDNYENVDQIPRPDQAAARARANEIKAALGLQDDDPADKGFTDLLEAAGYNVYRSETIVEVDPIFGTESFDYEFWGDVGERFDTDEFYMSQEQIDFLSQADLIIFSKDVDKGGYVSGREGGQPSTILIDQWNGLEVPIISMSTSLMTTNPFSTTVPGFGWSYGYAYTGNILAPYDRRDIQGSDRFVFPDMRPVVTTNVPDFLDGVTPVDDARVGIYNTELFPVLPQTHRKFNNNPNFEYAPTATILLEMDYPSFVVEEVGDIPTKDPVMFEIPANTVAFTDTGVCCDQPALNLAFIANPSERRLYFSAGVAGTGLYNLTEAGERIFLNAVAHYAGEPSGNGGEGLAIGEWNDSSVGPVWGYSSDWGWSAFMGPLNVAADPWIYQHPFGYLYPLGSFEMKPGETGYWMYSGDLEWIFSSDQGGGLFQSSSTGFDWDNFLTPRQ